MAASQVRGFRGRPPEAPLASYIVRVAQLQIATLSTIVAGVEMALGNPSGIFWLVPATIVTYVVGIINTWVLTVEVLR